jgi:hypothetical protein
VPSLLPRTRCALTAPFHPYLPLPGSFGGRFAFCCTVPGVAPAGNYPAPCFHGARTFLPALIRNAGRAAIRPADGANKGRSACYVKELLAGHCGARERATITRPSICKHGQARNLGEAATLIVGLWISAHQKPMLQRAWNSGPPQLSPRFMRLSGLGPCQPVTAF